MTYHEDEDLVELVAAALFERAMSERRTFSRSPQDFQATWDEISERMKGGWRRDARYALGERPDDDEETVREPLTR